ARHRARVLQAAPVWRRGQLRDRRVVPCPALVVPRGRGGVRAGVTARRAVRYLDGRRPRGEPRASWPRVRRGGIGHRNRRRRLHMTSDFTGDDFTGDNGAGQHGGGQRGAAQGGPAAAPGALAADARAVPPPLAQDPGHGVTDGDDGDEGPGLRASLEAILLVADEPVPEGLIAQVLERPRHVVAEGLRALAQEYTDDGRGFDLREIAGGWRFYTREDCAPLVERFVRDGQEVRLTQAALETLAVIAYRQPVSRAR